MIAMGAPCERVILEMDIMNQSPELKAYYAEHQDLFEFASFHSGLKMDASNPVSAVYLLLYLYDTLYVEVGKSGKFILWFDYNSYLEGGGKGIRSPDRKKKCKSL